MRNLSNCCDIDLRRVVLRAFMPGLRADFREFGRDLFATLGHALGLFGQAQYRELGFMQRLLKQFGREAQFVERYLALLET